MLPDLERELVDALLQRDRLARAWPKAATPHARAEIGQRIDDVDEQVADLYSQIAKAPAITIADVAVKLRRLLVVDSRSRCGKRLVATALTAVEGMAAG